MFIVVLCTIAKISKQLKCPSVDEWIKKLWFYTVEYNLAVKKSYLFDSMDGPGVYYPK